MPTRLVAIFEKLSEAEDARRKLLSSGISERLIRLRPAFGTSDSANPALHRYAVLSASLEQEGEADTVKRILDESHAADIAGTRVHRRFIPSESGPNDSSRSSLFSSRDRAF